MGQQDVSTSDIKVTQLPKLASDSENWLAYHKWVLNAATARGLCHHLVGTALKPSDLVKTAGKFRAPFLWVEAIHHAAWICAWIPSRALPGCITPIEWATGHKPNLKRVLAFGAVVWVKVKDAGKLDPQAVNSYFMGYDKESKGFHLYFTKR